MYANIFNTVLFLDRLAQNWNITEKVKSYILMGDVLIVVYYGIIEQLVQMLIQEKIFLLL